MYRYNKLLVNISLNDSDRDVIRYAAKLSKLANSDDIHFVHSVAEYPTSSQAQEEQQIKATSDSDLLKDLEKTVKKVFRGNTGTKLHFHVNHDNEVYYLLKFAKNNKLDIIILPKESNPTLIEKIGRKAPCSTMVVTPDAEPNFKRMVVLTDFSKYSENALEVGLRFAEANKLKKITAAHVFSVPYGYKRSALSEEDFMKMETKWLDQELKTFSLSVNNRGITVNRELVHGLDVPLAVSKYVDDNNIDLVVVASRGKDAFTSLLLGSTSSEILRNTTVPLVLVKEKGTGLSFLEELLHIGK